MKKLLALLLLALLWAAPVHAQQSVRNCQPGIGNSCNTLAKPFGNTVSAVESSHVMKGSTGTLSGFQVNNTNASSRWVLLFNATSAPANGAKTGCLASQVDGCVMKWYQIGGSSTMGVTWSPGPPLEFATGLVLTCSSTGPFTLTLATDCTFSAEVN